MFMCVLGRCVFYTLINTQAFRRAVTASVDSCAEVKSAPNFSDVRSHFWRSLEEGVGKQCSQRALQSVVVVCIERV